MKILIAFVFLFQVVVVKAQLEMAEQVQWTKIGELKTLGITKAKLEYHAETTDTVYFLLMRDFRKQQETNYFSVKFRGEGNTLAVFYELLVSFFTDENKKDKDYMKTFRLGKEPVNLQHCSLIGTHGVRLTTNDGYINLSKKDIDKLFGKR
ncbi:MAG: hypothetical protein QM791_09335 [Ferruginibacter sp.]